MTRSHALTLALAVLLPATALTADPKGKPDAGTADGGTTASADMPRMEPVQLVLLMRAPTWKKMPDDKAKELQKAHIGHLVKMGEAGHAVVCGPFGDQQDVTYRGACIYRVRSADEARELASQDPLVKAGQLRVEVVTWWTERGYMTFPKAVVPSAP